MVKSWIKKITYEEKDINNITHTTGTRVTLDNINRPSLSGDMLMVSAAHFQVVGADSHACVHTHKHTHIHIHTHTLITHTPTSTCTHIHTRTHIHTDAHMHVHIHTHTHTYTYTHGHTREIECDKH